MLVYRIAKCEFADDLSGLGASMYGGRWNSKGTYILYTAGSIALALAEALVHMNTYPSPEYCKVAIEIPDDNIIELKISQLPVDWALVPPVDILKAIGDTFVQNNKAIALKIPSVIVPEEFNYLLNPRHPDFSSKVRKLKKVSFTLDERLYNPGLR
ncbi:MAG: RES family NAD+ phosphorylase [Taibaiella sp.]|nr:RES family NAD+ phosphorylase [Taibaiella sp.]